MRYTGHISIIRTNQSKNDQRGFTIVELLIVIIVIAVLAAVTIVAFNGIRQRAVVAQVQSSLRSIATLMETDKAETGVYPSSIPSGYRQASGVDVTYVSGDATSYCIDGTSSSNSAIRYYVGSASSKSPKNGTCASSALTLPPSVMSTLRVRLEVSSITATDNSVVSTWIDLSGNGKDAVASGSPVYRNQAGTSYIEASSTNSLSTSSLGITGTQPRHYFALVNTTGSQGTFMGSGQAGSGEAFDLWHYNDGTLIWHGYSGGFDTVGSAPAMSTNAWHIAETWYDGTNVGVRLNGGTQYSVPKNIATQDGPLHIGKGNWANSWSGRVKAVLVFSQALTPADAQSVRDYLSGV